MEFLQGQPWPGNVRELENAVRRALLVRPGYPITLSDVHCAMAFSVPGTPKHEPSLAALVRENLGRAARGESLGVYAEMRSSLRVVTKSKPRAGSASRALRCGIGSVALAWMDLLLKLTSDKVLEQILAKYQSKAPQWKLE